MVLDIHVLKVLPVVRGRKPLPFAELEALQQKADEKSVADAKQMLKALETKKTVLRSAAQAKLDAAAALVVERIVSS